jgi:hypothetical protein
VANWHAKRTRQIDHILRRLGMQSMTEQNHLKSTLSCPERGEDRLATFKMFHCERSAQSLREEEAHRYPPPWL